MKRWSWLPLFAATLIGNFLSCRIMDLLCRCRYIYTDPCKLYKRIYFLIDLKDIVVEGVHNARSDTRIRNAYPTICMLDTIYILFDMAHARNIQGYCIFTTTYIFICDAFFLHKPVLHELRVIFFK